VTDAGILHVDLDAFFASVEILLDPALTGRPVAVGGTGARGVVAAASYEARRFGVESAMPMARARRLCPDLVALPPRIDVYQRYSSDVFEILRSFTPLVEPLSLDEAFLDVRGTRHLFGTGAEVGHRIRTRVREETGLVCSAGVATTKLLAKLASAAAKPDGLLVVEPGSEFEFLHPLPVERLWGVGPATSRRLDRLGVRTVGDLARASEESLVRAVGAVAGRHLHALAHNRDDRPVEPARETKSVSSEETFALDIDDRDELVREVRRQADRVATRLRRGGWVARTVTLKLRFPDFRTITRSSTLPEPTDAAADLSATAIALLDRVDVDEGIRLLGVGASNLDTPDARQQPLPLEERGRRRIDDVVDTVRERFGSDALAPASLLGPGGVRTGRRTAHSFGPDRDDA
jgi:DNA polymerase-4